MRTAGAAGRALLENAVRPRQSLLREFPNVMETIVKERLPVGAVLGQKGSTQAALKLGAASKAVRNLLTRATAEGTQYTADEVATPVLQLIDDLAKQPLGEAQEQQLAGMISEFLRRHDGPLTPLAVKELKQAAQSIAKPIYRAVERGMPVTADQTLSARFNSAIASGAKTALEKIHGMAEGEASAKSLIGATRAIKEAEARRLPLAAEGLSGAAAVIGSLMQPGSGLDTTLRNAVGAWLITRGFASPRAISRGGLLLTAKQTREVLRQFPRLAEFVASEVPRAGVLETK